MDNRIFNVNGGGQERLKQVLAVACEPAHIEGWTVIQNKGLVLLWVIDENNKSHNRLPSKLNIDSLTQIVWSWLESPEARKITGQGIEEEPDHDGDNEMGWRVYCEAWGHIGSDWRAKIAIAPMWLMYGK